MGTREISHAYPALKREWKNIGGYLLRLEPPPKGIPDFLLTHISTGLMLVEVKCVQSTTDIIGLEYHQAETLDKFKQNGGRAYVLVRCLDIKTWGVFFSGRLTEFYSILKFNMSGRYSTRLSPEFFR